MQRTEARHNEALQRRIRTMRSTSGSERVGRICKGAYPQGFPIEQPTTFELIVNLQTARALGIKIPDVVTVRADRLIY